jgi:hypothetical protein
MNLKLGSRFSESFIILIKGVKYPAIICGETQPTIQDVIMSDFQTGLPFAHFLPNG